MSRVQLIQPADAQGEFKDALDTVQKGMGTVPNLAKALANSPAVLKAYLALSGAVGAGLPAPVRERVALATAEHNGCDYCLSAHTYIAANAAKLPDSEIAAAREAKSEDAAHQAVLTFAKSVLTNRGHVADAELDALRAAGYGDKEIVDLVVSIALNILTNYFNHVAEIQIDFPVVHTKPQD
ncbi:carboxymuconolactone decarboxylase family protein [Streptomyces sp. NPDC093546]|uniref:carboxymuconolactone decarboxylase family protein n=1 Tax=Streptomyces sp. NPDC093546 TaxID=3366040 RepID=UPI0038240EE7